MRKRKYSLYMEGVTSTPTIDESGEFVRLRRELPPAHCILKVQSFSVLKNTVSCASNKYFQSTEFTSGGYNWVMHVYPNVKIEGEEDHVSIYVSVVDELNPGVFVNVALRLFIYDQIRDNYLTVQYLREKRFYAMKKSWGISNFLPVASLIEASNGFLVNDICFFGAEVLVLDHGLLQAPVLSMVSHDLQYTWRVEKFSENSGTDRVSSPVFTFGDWSWKLIMYPRRYADAKESSISVFLELQNVHDLIKRSKLYTNFCLSLKDPILDADYNRAGAGWFCSKSKSWGFRDFLPLSDLTNSYLVSDVLTIEVSINVMFLVKDMELRS